jgi:hypothetical protein
MKWWLNNAGGIEFAPSVLAALRMPKAHPREITFKLGIEDDLRHETVAPLVVKEVA